MADKIQTKHDRDEPPTPRTIDLDAGRRAFFRTSGLAAASASLLGAGALVGGTTAAMATTGPSEIEVLNFALNLEYLEAEFYLQAAFGTSLSASDTSGTVGTLGTVTGGRQVQFSNPLIADYAQEIANDELTHVRFLRSALGSSKVARPSINIGRAFHDAAVAAQIIPADGHFNAYDNDITFLLASYIFEDVGVTAYHGAAIYLSTPAYLSAAAGILAVEAYHAGIIRTSLFAAQTNDPSLQIFKTTRLISQLRSGLSASAISPAPTQPDDQGISANESQLDGGVRTPSNLVPTDANGIAFARTPSQVLKIVYGGGSTSGLFFPNGINAGNAS